MSTIAIDTTTYVYRLFSESDELLYVGISHSPRERWGQHKAVKPWWPDVWYISLEPFATRDEARQAEKGAIQREAPLYNLEHHPDREKRYQDARRKSGATLAGAHEIATMFGVSRQRVYQLTSSKDFPPPIARLKMGALWRTSDVVKWAESRGREINE